MSLQPVAGGVDALRPAARVLVGQSTRVSVGDAFRAFRASVIGRGRLLRRPVRQFAEQLFVRTRHVRDIEILRAVLCAFGEPA